MSISLSNSVTVDNDSRSGATEPAQSAAGARRAHYYCARLGPITGLFRGIRWPLRWLVRMFLSDRDFNLFNSISHGYDLVFLSISSLV